jgi:very-short-patch-repair endonuclease
LPAQIVSDRRRDKAFESAGWTVLILTKDDLADGFAGATAKIKRILRTAYLSPPSAAGFSRTG